MATKRRFQQVNSDDQPEPKRDRPADEDVSKENTEGANSQPESSSESESGDAFSDLRVVEVDDDSTEGSGGNEENPGDVNDSANRAQVEKSHPELSASDSARKIFESSSEIANSGLQLHSKTNVVHSLAGLLSKQRPGSVSFVVPKPVLGSAQKKSNSVKIVRAEECEERPVYPSPAAPATNKRVFDIVQLLVEDRYWGQNRSREREHEVLRVGRPTPALRDADSITDPKTGTAISLSACTYQKIPWLTGSYTLGKHFCWACLLFSDEEGKWSLPGNLGWKESSVAILNHQVSPGHVSAFKTLKQREEESEQPDLNKPPPTAPKSNEEIHQNRRFFELLIRILCAMKTRPQNTDMDFDGYEELMKVAIAHDPELRAISRKHLSEDGLIDFVSLHAEKLLTSIENVVKASIRRDVAMAPHVCLTYEDTKDIVDKSSLVAVIVRYVNPEGEIRERFVQFVRLPNPHDASAVTNIHSSLAVELGVVKKLVGFSYSGTIVPPSEAKGLNNSIRIQSPKSKYFRGPDHNLKGFLLQALSHVEGSRPFFQVIQDLVEFFSTNAGAIPTLVNFVKTSNPSSPLKVDEHTFTHDMILTIKHSYPQMVQFFERVTKRFWNDEVVHQAPDFINFLTSPLNRFLIALISVILSCVGDLSKVVESGSVPHNSAAVASGKLNGFKSLGPLPFMLAASDPKLISLRPEGPKRTIHPGLPKEVCSQLFKGIVGAAIACIANLCFKTDPFHLPKPVTEFSEVAKSHYLLERYIDLTNQNGFASLKEQIESFKAYELIFHKKTIQEHVKLMKSLNMVGHFPDLYGFLRFCILISPPQPNSSESTIAKLKSYVKNKQALYTSDLLLFLEKDSISKSVKDPQFFEAVIRNYKNNNEPIAQ